ncbi:hypothetical protein Tco_0861449 [Tanacetum coccineum]|uniref:Transposase (Putative), gypsy type n=1 Tax=Tanacetum coccineum TaxID=301880 RepID=A0ABQ5BKS1_9ASTR
MGLEAGSTFTLVAQETSTGAKSVSALDPLSYARLPPHFEEEEIKKLDEEIKSLRTVETEVHGLHNRTQNLETLLKAEVDMKKVAKDKNADLAKELESLLAQCKVEQQCAEIDARLDALSIDFDKELYPHMLTAIAGHRWVIMHGLRLAVMKYVESTELRQVFADIVSIGIVKGSEGFEIPASRSAREDAPQWICELRPSSSQLKIIVYPKVHDPKDPWSIKEEILLEDVIATNISCPKEKKKCRVVCRTHSVGSVHHARSEGIPV